MTYHMPIERAIRAHGHHDGERGLPSRARQYTGLQRELYERGYGKGFDMRYREEAAHKHHGNMGLPRPRWRQSGGRHDIS